MYWKCLFVFVLLVCTNGCNFSTVSSHHEVLPQKFIGVQTFHYFDESRSRPVVVELWYPTHSDGPFDGPDDFLWIHPKEVRNASLRESPSYPLIVMSHGHRGDRRDRSWLAEYLVQRGYVVASVEHFGNTREHFDPLISLRFWERPRDVTFALDQLLIDPFLKGKIDPNRIGFAGYSLGGMTGLSLAGAVAKNVKEAFFSQMEAIGEFQPEWGKAIDFSEAEKSYIEPRIRAFLLICPAIFVFPPESLNKIKAPIGLVAAINDEVLPHQEHAYQIIRYLVPHKLKVMRKEISHQSFLNRFSRKGKKRFKKARSGEEAVHREIGPFAVSFFDEFFF